MEGIEGSEIDTIRSALERAKKASQAPPLESQIRDCEQFLVRARAHLEELDTQRATVANEHRGRVEAIGIVESAEAKSASTRHDVRSAEVASIGGPAAVPTCTGWRCRTNNDTNGLPPIIKRCRREDFIPNYHEEMQEWMQGRQADLQTAVGAGQLQEVARISKLLTTAAQEW